MHRPTVRLAVAALVLALCIPFAVSAQNPGLPGAVPPAVGGSDSLPVTKVVLFSAGVGYFEHRGPVDGDATVSLPFAVGDINDALKSLVVRNGGAGQGSPSVNYPSMESLDRALKSFRIDLSGDPSVAQILSRLRGAEVSVDTPETVTGRIVGVEARTVQTDPEVLADYLVLLSQNGLRAFPLGSVQAIRFSDRRLSEDFNLALGLILTAQDTRRKTLEVVLPGSGTREAVLGYVVPAPIWKVAYRLVLSDGAPYFQGWAVVDNPSEQDWKDVALSLVSGRPVSFIQDLYTPLYVERPVVPLSIAGAAKPREFDSGFVGEAEERYAEAMPVPAPPVMSSAKLGMDRAAGAAPQAPAAFAAPAPGSFEAAQARAAGDQFEFTVKRPVTLDRRRSAMLPLLDSGLEAVKVSIYSPDRSTPMLGAQIVNTSGMKLPAGPVTVFDSGVYAGDALLDFLPENGRRLIAYGDDLTLGALSTPTSSSETTAVRILKGVLTFSRQTTLTRTYTFRNPGSTARKVIVEHPLSPSAVLAEPAAFLEKTASVYRFEVEVGAGKESRFVVRERQPGSDRYTISGMNTDSVLFYASSGDIPAAVRKALSKAVELRRAVEDAKKSLAEFQARKTELSTEQDRFRKNIETVGRDTAQGQQYLKRLLDAETEIEGINAKIAEARKRTQDSQAAYDSYLAGLNIE